MEKILYDDEQMMMRRIYSMDQVNHLNAMVHLAMKLV
jgi:hypothetical protein